MCMLHPALPLDVIETNFSEFDLSGKDTSDLTHDEVFETLLN